VLTSCKLVVSPSLRERVTGPSAPDQVMLNGVPTVMPAKVGSVNSTVALATATAAAATMTLVNCILYGLKGLEKSCDGVVVD
jgi:hypothetical protein